VLSYGIFGELLWTVLWIIVILALLIIIFWFFTGLATPFAAVPTDSMHPNIKSGDLIIMKSPTRNSPTHPAANTRIRTVSSVQGHNHASFGKSGDVIIFYADLVNSSESEQYIHRAHYWTQKGENWVTEINSTYVEGSCSDLPTCPAPNDGFITKGDNKDTFDQVSKINPVPEHSVIGVAQYRIPWLGHVRIAFDKLLSATHE